MQSQQQDLEGKLANKQKEKTDVKAEYDKRVKELNKKYQTAKQAQDDTFVAVGDRLKSQGDEAGYKALEKEYKKQGESLDKKHFGKLRNAKDAYDANVKRLNADLIELNNNLEKVKTDIRKEKGKATIGPSA